MKRFIRLIPLLVAVLMFSCKSQRLKVDLSNVKIDLEIDRFEQALFSIPPDQVDEKIPELYDRYGRFLERFSYVINIGQPGDPGYSSYLRAFLTDTMVQDVYRRVETSFPDLTELEGTLREAFRHYHYYFPDRDIPSVYTYISGFNPSLIIDKGILGIGLDKYLGKGTDYYVRLGLPKYMRDKMHPEKIPSDCMYYWASTEFPMNDSVNNVLSNMIYEGQLLYFTRAMMPDMPDSLIMGYSPAQIRWLEDNEKDMYTYLVENKLLFDRNTLTINKLVRDAPFTQYFSTDSPGRTGSWLGWQIVRSYMDHHPEMDLPALMAERDYQALFSRSRYRP